MKDLLNMPAKFENKLQRIDSRIWVGKYHTLHNLPHWHLAPELIACQSGSATVVVEGHSLCITAGEVAVCHGGSIHFINTEQNGLLLVAQVDPALVESIVGQRRLNDLVFKDKFGTTDRLDAIFAELQEKKPYYSQRADAMISELLIDIFRSEPSSAKAASRSSNAFIRYKDLLQKIGENYEFITFQDAASFMSMSDAYFSKFFKKLSGMTFSDYLNLVKVDRAVEMLHQDPFTPSTTLMLECGFNTLRHFYRVFKEFTGYAPRQLPPDFSINLQALSDDSSGFDPTLPSTIQL